MRTILIWGALVLACALPIVLAAQSPLLAWRQPIYIAAGFAGIIAMALLLAQPLLAAGHLPGLYPRTARRIHALVGLTLLLLIAAHVGGLWITSPPDVVDALLFRSPTPFSIWGVIAMWAVMVTALLARFHRRVPHWPIAHRGLALIIVAGSISHALLIEGTMEPISKFALCALAGLATLNAVLNRPGR
ncbi:ferric reductase [Sulfitobacter sp. TSTF-M16]|uniref:Ferric reductase n=1 Tax=Sulfitobacter aestuariivivens TaxID=2766981 RepID=A0A927D5Y4_9RHOB|nr:ferric reductase [Sulfitobacter aestuariivivens]